MGEIDKGVRVNGVRNVWKGIRSNDKSLITETMYELEDSELLYVYGTLRSELYNRSLVPHLDVIAAKVLEGYAMFLENCYKEIRCVRSVMEKTSSLPDTYQTYQTQMVALGMDPMTHSDWMALRENLMSGRADVGN